MKRRILGAALAVCVSLVQSCTAGLSPAGNSANGSVGISRDDALVYAVDADLDTLFVVDAATNAKKAEIKVGRQPEKLLVGVDDTVFVANRMSRSVSVIRRGDTSESARIDTAVEPVGLAQSADGKMLFVVSATSLTSNDFGVLQAFDASTLTLKWELPVGHEPRAITLLPGDKAMIALSKDGQVVTVDVAAGKVIAAGNDSITTQLNRSALGLTTSEPGQKDLPTQPIDIDVRHGGSSTVHPRGFDLLVPSIDGKRVYVGGLLSSDTVINTRTSVNSPNGSGGETGGYGSQGCSGATSVSAAAIVTVEADGTPLVDDMQACGSRDSDRPQTVMSSGVFGLPVQGPTAAALDPSGQFLFVANRNTNNVSIVNLNNVQSSNQNEFSVGKPDVTSSLDPTGQTANGTSVVNVGSNPTGIAVAHKGNQAWVFNAFDHSVSRLERDEKTKTVVLASTLVLGADVLNADAVAGRKLFFSALDSRMNNPGTGISCNTCHLEGREDGHVWNFIDGPRQTPSLAGRMTEKTAPFHWNGEFPDLMAFMTHTVTRSMGGSGVTPAMEKQIAAFISTIPAADNALKTTAANDAVARGKIAYTKAACDTCHTGEALTNNSFADVGTFVKNSKLNDDLNFFAQKGLNTPSLLGISRSAPYLHDGSAPTLKARIVQGKSGNMHGATASLSDAEVDDLVTYLNTL